MATTPRPRAPKAAAFETVKVVPAVEPAAKVEAPTVSKTKVAAAVSKATAMQANPAAIFMFIMLKFEKKLIFEFSRQN